LKSIYTDNKYQSYNLDFIARNTVNHKKIEADLAEIGFSKDGNYYKHPDTAYFIEFPAPPPAGQVEQITLALIYKFMSNIDRENINLFGGKSFFERSTCRSIL